MIYPPPLPFREAAIRLALVLAGGLMLAGAALCWLTPEGASLWTGL